MPALFLVLLSVMMLRLATSTLFPYTTLFRSPFKAAVHPGRPGRVDGEAAEDEGGKCGCHPPSVTAQRRDRKSTRLNSSHLGISYAVFCLKKKMQDSSRQEEGNRSEYRLIICA